MSLSLSPNNYFLILFVTTYKCGEGREEDRGVEDEVFSCIQ